MIKPLLVYVSIGRCSLNLVRMCANSGQEIMPIAHMDLFPNALFNLFTLSDERYILLTGTSPPNLPLAKGRDVLSFSILIIEFLHTNYCVLFFTIIEFSLYISFQVAMQHTSPLAKGRKRGDYL